jgi:hypothetical protein
MKARDPMNVFKARKSLEEQRRILRKAWVRATGSVDTLVSLMLDDVEDKLKRLTKGETK